MEDETDNNDTPVDLTKTTGTEAPAPNGAATTDPAPKWAKILTVVSGVLVVALVAVGAWLIVDRQSDADRDERREAQLQAARQTVLNLTTIGVDTAEEDVARLLEGATGDFKAEFEGREGPFVEVVQQAGVNTTGEVLEAGIQNEDGTCTSSLVAARAMVSNAEQTEPEPRDFRLRVTICDENGRLAASKVEFVP